MNNKNAFLPPAQRISSFEPYFFASLGNRISQLKQKGVDVIRIDMGSPDLPPAGFIIEELVEKSRRSDTHGYSPTGGTQDFKKAVAQYYLDRFEVNLDPQTEVIGLIGSKEGLFNLSQVILNPGDIALVPDPGYPVYSASGIIAGGRIVNFPLLEENHFLPDLEAIPAEVLKNAKILWLNYPNNPTGAIASLSFFEEVITFARKHRILVAHDAPYVDICFDGYTAPSLMQVPGAKDVAIEFNSLSKTYNMAGWRLGMAVGNPEVIDYLFTYKSQMDTSTFGPIFSAGVKALTGDQSWLEERNEIYKERRDLVVRGLKSAGFSLDTPHAAIYVWAKLPDGERDSIAFCSRLLEETGVSTTPGIVYGEHGEGFLRISLGTSTDRIREAMERIVDWKK
ncbi:MAG TPA: aminotransferase class I/II-fold pyridoxal phosphate-dependent enzyme [Anaerolineaceae bacterium]|nr:aminotransferase class I/II-fold pyridoxal phosphate-dependent enzyme [Anaerolineaceae bacterium]